jgi:NhaA family Na+:H+ antiporter
LRIQAASGIVLIVAAIVAIVLANSRFHESYRAFWVTEVGIQVGAWSFRRSLEWVVNDGLMVIFFFVVGLEIRRELHHGELSTLRRAALPAIAALGGMLAPAGCYLLLAHEGPAHAGWGVPMATDIAFALGVLTLLGKRVPPALRVLLLALAVIDDLGAIIVIALFYSSGIKLAGLGVALVGVLVAVLLKRLGVRQKLVYVLPGLVVWCGVYAAGIHPTIAGVIMGLLTPVTAWLGTSGLRGTLEHQLAELKQLEDADRNAHADPHQVHVVLKELHEARRETVSPAESLIETLHPWVAFVIMPVFALANAGVHVSLQSDTPQGTLVLGAVLVGLVIGKPLGIGLGVALATKARLAVLPLGLGARHIGVLGLVAGIGFTMALFVAQLAFNGSALLDEAKLGVLSASLVMGVLSLVAGRVLLGTEVTRGAAETADEAEASTTK